MSSLIQQLMTINIAFACTIKGNLTNGSISNCGLQLSNCKFHLMDTLLYHMIATKITQLQETTIKVTSQDGNLTRRSGINGGL